ncbi:ubiquitin thioesterase OTUB1-like [Lineus longissimus]|uniref:ubiquitin thioesterase OTUB1-like n=1 Tax=Lineus longissimus TaxID=88925 RepID=UPI002B4F1B70
MAEDDRGLHYDQEANIDDAIRAQERAIEKEVATTQALISDRLDFSVLEEQYSSDEAYLLKVRELRTKYTDFRKTRGDGNCFFRAFGFRYLEQLLEDSAECKKFKQRATQCKDDLISLGYSQFTVGDFHDYFMEVLEKVENHCTVEELLEIFRDQANSDYLVVYLRLFVSAYLQKEHEFFSCFMEDGKMVSDFCSQEVEPMNRESDHIHIAALTKMVEVPIRVVYMDRMGTTLTTHDFLDDAPPKIVLLYRPGHYDILYF